MDQGDAVTDALLHGFSLPSKAEADFINIVSAKDCTLVDDQGKQYIDAMASLWLCQIGHGNAKVINAIKDQLDQIYWDKKNGTNKWVEAIDKVKSDNPKP